MTGSQPGPKVRGRKRVTRSNVSTETKSPSSSPKKDSKQDESLLTKPIQTSTAGLCKASQVLQSGTLEVRKYLSNECDIIYECRVCRSLFRSMANFILHKRRYCLETYNRSHHSNFMKKFEDDEALFIESEIQKSDEEKVMQNASKIKDLASIVQRLTQEKTEILDENSTEDVKEIKKLKTQSIDGNKAGVFQTFLNKMDLEKDMMKNEVMELHNMIDNDEAVIGPNGQCLGFRSGSIKNSNNVNIGIVCSQCNMKFSTRKTLKFHINTKHNDTRMVYSCPECSEIFASPWSVYRHLYKVHRKTTVQVRRLRNTIQARACRIDRIPASRRSAIQTQQNSAATPLTEEQRREEENRAWMENLESDNDFQCCGGCGRRFERRAALNSHSQLCQKRIAARANLIVNTAKLKPRVASDDEKQVPRGAKRRKPLLSRKINNDDIIMEDIKEMSSNSSSNSSPDSSRPQSVVGEFEISEIIGCDPLLLVRTNLASGTTSPEIFNSQPEKLTLLEDDPLSDKSCTIELEKDPLADSNTNSTVADFGESNPLSFSDNETQSSNHFIIVPDKQILSTNIEDSNESSTVFNKTEHFNEDKNNLLSDYFGKKIKEYVSIGKKLMCNRCVYKCSNMAALKKHMSFHFHWMRFKCIHCDYLSYDKRSCIMHAQTNHHATIANIKKYVCRLHEAQSIKLCSRDFLPLNTTPHEVITLDDSDNEEEKKPKTKSGNQDTSLTSSENNTSTNSECILVSDDNDGANVLSRKTIMEVIGISTTDHTTNTIIDDLPEITVTKIETNIEEKAQVVLENVEPIKIELKDDKSEANNVQFIKVTEIRKETKSPDVTQNTRPVRNRVKPINKDFIYDLSTIPKHDTDFYSKNFKRKNDEGKSSENELKKKRRRNSKTFARPSSSDTTPEKESDVEKNSNSLVLTQRTEIAELNQIVKTVVFDSSKDESGDSSDALVYNNTENMLPENIMSVIT